MTLGIVPLVVRPEPSMSVERNVSRVDPAAYALTLFRGLKNGDGRTYTAVTFPQDPWQGCERTIRIARAVGWITEPTEDGYGVLDVLNEDGDIVQDFTVTTARAFQKLKKRLNLTVEHEEATA